MAAYESYTANLTEASLKKAKDELHETPEENRSQLKHFTDWIDQHKTWLTTPTDPVFLMQFLRVRKFSQLLARESLVNFLLAREKEPHYFKDIDCDDPKILAVFRDAIFVPLPQRDKHGRQICVFRSAKMDISGSSYTMVDIMKTMFMIFDYLLRDENVQVNGIVVYLDFSRSTMKHEAFAGDHRVRILSLITKAYPLRMKNFLVYNAGPLMEIVMTLFKTVLKEKLQKRIVIMSDMVSIYEILDKSALPLEYLPDDYKGEHADTCTEILDNLLTTLRKPEYKKWTEELSSGRYRVDERKMPPREELFQEAFRKLNIQ